MADLSSLLGTAFLPIAELGWGAVHHSLKEAIEKRDLGEAGGVGNIDDAVIALFKFLACRF